MILPIYIYGQPVLRKEAQDIPLDYPGLQELIQHMLETMDASDGIGLAAPQIGLDIRLLVIDLNALSDTYPVYAGFRRAFINAHIVEVDESSEKEILEEGCLSLPGIHERVTRHTRIRVQYVDEAFQTQDEGVEGYLARVLHTRSITSTADSLSTISRLSADKSSAISSKPFCREDSNADTEPRNKLSFLAAQKVRFGFPLR